MKYSTKIFILTSSILKWTGLTGNELDFKEGKILKSYNQNFLIFALPLWFWKPFSMCMYICMNVCAGVFIYVYIPAYAYSITI